MMKTRTIIFSCKFLTNYTLVSMKFLEIERSLLQHVSGMIKNTVISILLTVHPLHRSIKKLVEQNWHNSNHYRGGISFV